MKPEAVSLFPWSKGNIPVKYEHILAFMISM